MRCFVLGEIRVLVLHDLSGSIHYMLLVLSLSSGGSAAPKKSLDV